MPPIPRSTFRRRLNTLDSGALTAFVSDLWAARGFETTVEDGVVRLERPAGTAADSRRLVIHHVPYLGGRFTLPWGAGIEETALDDGDVIVTNAPEQLFPRNLDADPVIVDTDDLYDIAFYAIPRDRCRSLLGDHLGFEEIDVPYRDRSVLSTGRRRSAQVATWVLIVVTILGLVAGGLLTSGIGAQSSIDSAGSVVDGVTPLPPTATPSPPTATATSAMSMLAPGVTREGRVNPIRLAAAHEQAITGSAYTWTLTYREYGPNYTLVMNETVRVSTPAFYVTDVTRDGTPVLPTPINDREVYADTQLRYERILSPDGVRFMEKPIDGHSQVEGRNANRAEGYIRQLLAGESSRYSGIESRGDRTLFMITTTGDPRANITNATTIAWIDDNGLVYELRRQHQPAGHDDVFIEITWRYSRIGNTSVSPPEWYLARQNATG